MIYFFEKVRLIGNFGYLKTRYPDFFIAYPTAHKNYKIIFIRTKFMLKTYTSKL